MVNRLLKKVDTAIAEQEKCAAGVSRFETDFSVPVARTSTRVTCLLVASVVIDRNDGRTITVAVVRISPPFAHVFRTTGPHFAKKNGLRQTIGHARELRCCA